MADIFISYSRADRPRCKEIRDALAELKIDIWFDEGIASGDSFDRKIEAEIDCAKAVMALWSENSVESQWVRNEARSGAERDSLIAVALDESKLPLEFRSFHTEVLPKGGEKEAHPVWLNILGRIGDLLGRPGLADYARLQHQGANAAAWKAWVTRYAGDPLAGEVIDDMMGSATPEMQRQLSEERAKIAGLEAELSEYREAAKAQSGEVATSGREVARMRRERDAAEQAKDAAESELEKLRAGSGLTTKRGFWEADQSGVGLVLDDRLGIYIGGMLWVLTVMWLFGPIRELWRDSAGLGEIIFLVIGIVFLLVPTIIVTVKLFQRRMAAIKAAQEDAQAAGTEEPPPKQVKKD